MRPALALVLVVLVPAAAATSWSATFDLFHTADRCGDLLAPVTTCSATIWGTILADCDEASCAFRMVGSARAAREAFPLVPSEIKIASSAWSLDGVIEDDGGEHLAYSRIDLCQAASPGPEATCTFDVTKVGLLLDDADGNLDGRCTDLGIDYEARGEISGGGVRVATHRAEADWKPGWSVCRMNDGTFAAGTFRWT